MRVLFVSLFIVIADQLSKFFVKGGTIPLLNLHVNGMSYGGSVNLIGDFFKLTFVENPGIAFGIDVNGVSKLLLSLFTLLASLGVFYYLWKSKEQKLIIRLALAFILGGAIGNLIDRTFYGLFYGYAPLFYGKVVDFFNMDFFDFTIFGRTYDRFPIFNIADSSVTVGVALLLIFHRTHTVDAKEVESETIDTTLNNNLTISEKNKEIYNSEKTNSSLSEDNKNNVENYKREEIQN
ncbi:MAG: signal peptidase II [Ignavibacteriales bacterium]|nr:MAG: signal peptidase II [Ignavibacteriales bacterium]